MMDRYMEGQTDKKRGMGNIITIPLLPLTGVITRYTVRNLVLGPTSPQLPLTHCLLVSSAHNLCKQIDAPMVFLKVLFKKVDQAPR